MADKEISERETLKAIAEYCESTAAAGSKEHNDFCRFTRKKDKITSKFCIALYKGKGKHSRRICFLYPAINDQKLKEGKPVLGAWLQNELNKLAKRQEAAGFLFTKRREPLNDDRKTEGYVADFGINADWGGWNNLSKSEKDKIRDFYDLLMDWQKENWSEGGTALDGKLQKWNSDHRDEYESYLNDRNIPPQNEETSTSIGSDKEGGREDAQNDKKSSPPQATRLFDAKSIIPLPFNRIFFGAPGTGKSFTLNEAVKAKRDAEGKPVEDGQEGEALDYERVTFYPTYSYAQFVGCYKPVMDGKELAYKFVPGPFLRILVKALNDSAQNYCLVIEEINRANAAAVFGDVFQLLDRKGNGESEYEIAASEDVRKFLLDAPEKGGLNEEGKKVLGFKGVEKESLTLKIPSNMYIWATMNSADQGVFPMDTAFKRRWKFKYFEINQSDDKIVGRKIGTDLTIDGKSVYTESNWTDPMKKWNDVRKFINRLLSLFKVNEDKLMGPWFVQPESEDEISAEQFESKVLMYLWEDAARMCRQKMFPDSVTNYSELITEWRERGVGIFARLMENDQVGRKDSVASGLWDKELGMAPKS